MKLSIFGASGKTGRSLVEQALAAGHEVVAFVRTPSKLPLQHEQLTLLQGDATDGVAVARAVEGSDAVLSALGHTKGSPKDLQTVATRHIVAAMKAHGVKRLVSLTGAGVSDPKDAPKLADRVVKFLLQTISGAVLKDAEAHAEVIRSSGLEWTIVRGPRLTDGPRTSSYRIGFVGKNSGLQASRANVADFMLKAATDTLYLHQAPMVSD